MPFNFVSPKLEGVTFIEPATRVDLVHAFNRIPVNSSKFIMSFESHLPRHFALARRSRLVRYMTSRIADARCRRIIALSHFAKRQFLAQHAGEPEAGLLADKLMVRHPNIVVPDLPDALADDPVDRLRIIFIGAHFGRKGGCVAVRMAEKALRRGLPLEVTVVSSLKVGGPVWTDPTDPAFFEPYLKLLDLENVSFHRQLPNPEVRRLLRASHFSILATFADTFGYSAIESMSEHTPVIGTGVCALPEFLTDGVNGIVLPVQMTDTGEWWTPGGYAARGEKAYADHFRDEVERLADGALRRIEGFLGDPASLRPLRREARGTAERMFASEAAGSFLDDLYERVAAEDRGSGPHRPVRRRLLAGPLRVPGGGRLSAPELPDHSCPQAREPSNWHLSPGAV